MILIPIKVRCHAGYKADEYPERFFWEERWIEVQEIVDRCYQGDRDPEWPIADYFKVTDADGRSYMLKHDRGSDEWFLQTRPEDSQPAGK